MSFKDEIRNAPNRPQKETLHKELLQNAKTLRSDSVALLNPQGVVGEKSINYMNAPGTTCMGGQIPFVRNLANGLKAAYPKNEVSLWTQRTTDKFDGSFREGFKTSSPKGSVKVFRKTIVPKGDYIDKEDVKDGKNSFYPNLPKYIDDFVQGIALNKMPKTFIANYWDGIVMASHLPEKIKSKGFKGTPNIIAIPHSLGYRKLVSMLKENSSKEMPIDKNLSAEKATSIVKDVVFKQLDKLMDDPKYMFPSRILTERIGFSSSLVKGCLNAESELNTQLLATPYKIPFKDYKSVEYNMRNLTVINPGIDTNIFGLSKNPEMARHEKFAKGQFDERVANDIKPERKELPSVVLMGRLNKDKNFHGVVSAFEKDTKLNNRSNLVLVINGPERKLNVNYVKEMQNFISYAKENGFNINDVLNEKVPFNNHHKEIKLDSFKGTALEQLVNLAQMLDKPELECKWTSVSLPNGKDYAGLQRVLGNEKKAVGGLFSFKEPYGLAPFETANCGIPVCVSSGSGAAPELMQHGAASFNPFNPKEIAKAINDTFDIFEDIRTKQIAYANTKSWESTAHRYMDVASNESSVNSNEETITPIYPGDESFIKDGKSLLKEAIKLDFEKGDFNDLIDGLTKRS